MRLPRTRWVIAAAGLGSMVSIAAFGPSPADAAVILDQCPTLAEGYYGGCVGELQVELNEDIGANLAVDDDFGPATRAAVVTFQSSMGVTPDGIVGPETKGALDISNSVATPSPGAPLDPGGVLDGGKSVSECLSEEVGSKALEDFAQGQAAARGYELAEVSPWIAGAKVAGCILFGI